MLVNENRWRASRDGLDAGLIDVRRMTMDTDAELLQEILELVREDAEALGCTREIGNARAILERRTSADVQLRLYREARDAGASAQEACMRVVDWLIEETMQGL